MGCKAAPPEWGEKPPSMLSLLHPLGPPLRTPRSLRVLKTKRSVLLSTKKRSWWNKTTERSDNGATELWPGVRRSKRSAKANLSVVNFCRPRLPPSPQLRVGKFHHAFSRKGHRSCARCTGRRQAAPASNAAIGDAINELSAGGETSSCTTEQLLDGWLDTSSLTSRLEHSKISQAIVASGIHLHGELRRDGERYF